MIPWECLDRTKVSGNNEELTLVRRGDEFSIRIGVVELMNSRVHGSEDQLAYLTCDRLANCADARMLIGGLGMGFTTAAALQRLGPDATVVVAELVSAVVSWNHGPLSHLAGLLCMIIVLRCGLQMSPTSCARQALSTTPFFLMSIMAREV